MEIGNILKKTRTEKNLSLAQVEEEIKIRQKYLVALENENFNIIPGRVYVKGFLRNYARYLGLNAEELVWQYEKQYPPEEAPPNQILTRGKSFTWRLSHILAIFILGLLLILGISWFTNIKSDRMHYVKSQSGSYQQTKLPAENHPDLQNNNSEGQKGNIVYSDGSSKINLVLHVIADRCWVEVVADGEIKFTGELTANQIKTFHGKENIKIKLGNAGVVQVKVNGRDLGFLGARGEVIKWEYPDSIIS